MNCHLFSSGNISLWVSVRQSANYCSIFPITIHINFHYNMDDTDRVEFSYVSLHHVYDINSEVFALRYLYRISDVPARLPSRYPVPVALGLTSAVCMIFRWI